MKRQPKNCENCFLDFIPNLTTIDHKEPCAKFDLSKPEEQRRCFHFSNLQPLFVRDNLSKGARVIPTQRGFLLPW